MSKLPGTGAESSGMLSVWCVLNEPVSILAMSRWVPFRRFLLEDNANGPKLAPRFGWRGETERNAGAAHRFPE